MTAHYIDHVRKHFHPYLLPLKALFFFQIGATACLIPYFPLFIQHLGLNAAENGIIYGTLPFLAMLSKPLSGYLLDKFKAPFTIIRFFSVLQLVFMCSLYFVPKIEQPGAPKAIYDISCLNGTLFPDDVNIVEPHLLPPTGNLSCTLVKTDGEIQFWSFQTYSLVNLPAMENLTACGCSWVPDVIGTVDQSLVRWRLQFWLTGLLLIFAWIGYGALFTLGDTVAFGVIESSPVTTTYGSNRVWGTIGYGTLSLLMALLLDTFSTTISADRDFTPAFGTFAAAAFCGIVVTFFFRGDRSRRATTTLSTDSTEKFVGGGVKTASMRSLLTAEVLLFGIGTFTIGTCSGMLYGYLGWYQAELGASNLLLGLTIFADCLYEAPMMAVSGWVIRKLGYHGCMVLALLSYGARFVAYHFVIDPWVFMATEMAHAFGFGLFYANMASFAFDKAPIGAAGTLQGILGALYEGFGQGIGGMSAGFLYQAYGGRATWLGFGLFAIGIAVAYFLCFVFLWKRSRNQKGKEIKLTVL